MANDVTPTPGDYFVVSYPKENRNLVQRAICFATKSEFSHAGIVAEDGDSVYEASFSRGFARTDGALTRYRERGATLLFSDERLTADQRGGILAACRSLIGVDYGWLDVLALALAERGIVPKWVWERLASPSNMICSFAVVWVYRAAGHVLFPRKADVLVTPADLADRLSGVEVRDFPRLEVKES